MLVYRSVIHLIALVSHLNPNPQTYDKKRWENSGNTSSKKNDIHTQLSWVKQANLQTFGDYTPWN